MGVVVDERKGGVGALAEANIGVLQDRGEITEQEAAQDQIAQAHEACGSVAAQLLMKGRLFVILAHKVFVANQQRRQEQRGFLGHHRGKVEGDDSQLRFPGQVRPADIEKKRQQKKQCGFQFGNAGNPIDRLGVDGVQRKQCRGDGSNRDAFEEFLAREINDHDDQGVQQNVEQVIAERQVAEGFPQQEIGERHQRTIVVGFASRTDEGPDRGVEDLRKVAPAFDVGIGEDL